tara:strand:+ start:1810 stop:2031 length:222 start_codon:yes stop_codon:yes gene_type:complete
MKKTKRQELMRLKKLALSNHKRALSYYSDVEKLIEDHNMQDDFYQEFQHKLMMSKFAHSHLDAFHDHLKKQFD